MIKNQKQPKFKRQIKSRNINFKAPEHFYNGIVERAESFDMRMSEYITACIVYDMNNDVVGKEIKRANDNNSMFQLLLYPTVKRV